VAKAQNFQVKREKPIKLEENTSGFAEIAVSDLQAASSSSSSSSVTKPQAPAPKSAAKPTPKPGPPKSTTSKQSAEAAPKANNAVNPTQTKSNGNTSKYPPVSKKAPVGTKIYNKERFQQSTQR